MGGGSVAVERWFLDSWLGDLVANMERDGG